MVPTPGVPVVGSQVPEQEPLRHWIGNWQGAPSTTSPSPAHTSAPPELRVLEQTEPPSQGLELLHASPRSALLVDNGQRKIGAEQ